MALARHTDILLLNEPTTFLDLAHQIEVLDLVPDGPRPRQPGPARPVTGTPLVVPISRPRAAGPTARSAPGTSGSSSCWPNRATGQAAGTEWLPPTPASEVPVPVLLLGDETAVPAVSTVLGSLPPRSRGHALLEVPGRGGPHRPAEHR